MDKAPTCFIDPTAKIYVGVVVWHYAVVLDHVSLGVNVSIGSRCEIGSYTEIGHSSRIGSGTFLPRGTKIGHNVFIGPNVTFTDDKYPKVNNTDYEAQPPIIGNNASIGAGAVILPNVTIGEFAMVGAGAIVTKDVPPHAVVRCEPAKIQE